MGYGRLNGIPKEVPYLDILRAVGESQFLRTRPLGIPSDDAQQATLLAITAERNRSGWDEMSTRMWANNLIRATRANIWRGYGKMFKQSVDNLVRGHGYRVSGTNSAGIGAAMRSGPLGIIYSLNLDSLRVATIESSLVTHRDVRAVAIAYANTWLVYAFLNDFSYFLARLSKLFGCEQQ